MDQGPIDKTSSTRLHRQDGGAVIVLAPRLWWQAIRPRTLSLAAVPVLVGAALAMWQGAQLNGAVLAVTLLAALLIQAATNLLNDAEDAGRGNDGPDRLGPQRITGAGLATSHTVKRSAFLLFALALLAGVLLVLVGGWPILALGLAALLAGWAYSGGPVPLSHTPFGELFVVAFFGIAAVVGTFYLQADRVAPEAWLTGLALGLHAAAVLIMNNIRDREADTLAGRRTLAILLGRKRALLAYGVFMLLPFLVLGLALGATGVGLGWIALPYCAWLAWRAGAQQAGAAMNRQMGLTATAQLLLGGLLTLNLILVSS
ncbi:MAG: 1,4-dihydroxy-2-naphthoate octaprenyltransferase [Xanthomonadales bacterium]|nr:1,4-dihydroxy-2-naphthoate octaprenyltransferase [Xanthomonadales bacterium]